MPNIVQPTQAPEYDDSRKNEVVGITEVRFIAVAWVNAEGRKSMCLALSFGKDAEDKGPGVFILADESQMSEQLRMANSTVKKGVRKWLGGQKETTAEDIPESLSIDTPMNGPTAEDEGEDMADNPLAGILPD